MIRDVNNIKIAVICTKEQISEIEGADFVGSLDLIEKIRNGWLDFDILLITPEMLSDVESVARILESAEKMPTESKGMIGSTRHVNLCIFMTNENNSKDLNFLEKRLNKQLKLKDEEYFQKPYPKYSLWLLTEMVKSLQNNEHSVN